MLDGGSTLQEEMTLVRPDGVPDVTVKRYFERVGSAGVGNARQDAGRWVNGKWMVGGAVVSVAAAGAIWYYAGGSGNLSRGR